MSEISLASNTSDVWTKLEAQASARERIAAELVVVNKTAPPDVLAASAVATVLVSFDGSGDSGQIESIDAVAGGVDAALPETSIEIAAPT